MNIIETERLGVFTWYRLLRDAVIYRLAQTDEGVKKLREAWYYEQSEPDLDKLNQFSGKGAIILEQG